MTLAAGQALAAGHGFLSPTGVEVAFLLVGIATLGAAVITVTTKQLVHAALWLVVALGGLAVEYLLLTAEFIAWVQVLIYVGSVIVLLLFGLMLTRAPIGRSPDADSGNRWVALAVAVAAAATLVWVVVDAFRATWIDLDAALPEGGPGSTRVTGEFLFRHWVLPFEALSVLLLAALVGAIVLSRKDRTETGGPAGRRLRTGGGAGGTGPVGGRSGRRTGPAPTKPAPTTTTPAGRGSATPTAAPTAGSGTRAGASAEPEPNPTARTAPPRTTARTTARTTPRTAAPRTRATADAPTSAPARTPRATPAPAGAVTDQAPSTTDQTQPAPSAPADRPAPAVTTEADATGSRTDPAGAPGEVQAERAPREGTS